MSAESEESTIIQLNVMMTVYLKAFPTPEVRFAGMVTWIIQLRVKFTVR